MGISGEDIEKTLKNLNLGKDEMDKLTKAFKDEKFIQLFADYAKEVSDPKNRAENEAYLRQLEGEGRAEEFYGKGSQLIVPEPGFVIKTSDAATKEKFFINVCTNEKVGPAKSTKTQGGENWDIPFSLGAIHQEVDNGNKPCSAADFCVFDDTLKLARERPRFMSLVVETVIEECEKRFSLKLDREVKFPKAKYVGAGTDGKPRVQVIKGEAVPGADKGGPAATSSRSSASASGSSSSAATAAGAGASEGPGARSKFAFPAPSAKPAASSAKPAARKAAEEAEAKKPKGPFEYELVHQSRPDLGNTWKDVRGAADTSQLDRLVVRVRLPEVAAVSDITLDTSKTTLLVAAHGKELLIPLPREVDEEKSSAKWDKGKRVLEVTLSVIPKAAPAAAAQPVAAVAGAAEVEAEAEAAAAEEEEAQAEAAAAAAAAGAAQREEEAARAREAAEREVSENEARWRAVHAAAHAAEAAAAAEAGASASASAEEAAASEDEDDEPRGGAAAEASESGLEGMGAAGAERGSDAGSGERSAAAAAAAKPAADAAAPPATSAVLLKPRLRSVESVCDELD